jgi:ribonucleoside-diphosphate reductase alpha chain
MSILVSDAFMQAVQEDEEWVLHFTIPPVTRDLSSNPNLEQYDFEDDDGVQQYVYSVWRARDLWEKITTTTYEYSEPGVIFIDRVNALNNLQYVETIRCTNPCGEQPLPPYGTCNLAHAVLSRMVKNPFTEDAYFDFELLQVVTFLGIRFLDNVIEVTNYPLDLQRDEEFNKRRLGFGVAGLADALAQLGIRYGSIKGAKIAEEIQRTVAIASYEASVALAIERKRFPLFDPKITDCGFIAKKLPSTLRDGIATHGLRNGVLNTIAPTGTTSLAYGNISSGVEPVFAHSMRRRILQPDSSFVNHDEESFIFRFWKHCTGRSLDMSLDSLSSELPDYMITTSKLSVAEHIRMQAACQSWVDASVSKTVNCPEEMTYDEFITVYELAYATGCKGCTTYRPSKVRGSILEDLSKDSQSIGLADTKLRPTDEHPIKERAKRVDVLSGDTYKVRWPSMTAAMYITINKSDDGRPYEMFFASKDARHSDWMTALTLMISGILRSGIDPSFVAEELKQVTSMHDTAWINGKFYASPVAYIGGVIERHLVKDKDRGKDHLEESSPEKPTIPFLNPIQQGSEPKGEMCPKCYAPAVIYAEGCKKCTNCDYTQCG